MPLIRSRRSLVSLMTPVMVVFAFVVVSLAPSAIGQEYPALSGRVVDAANILPADIEASLTETLRAWDAQSSDQVVVATVPALGDIDIEQYANELFSRWQLGQGEADSGRLDNGVLFLIAPNERQVRIEVGYGLEGTLTDVLAFTIIRREVLPAFKAGDMPRGVVAGIEGILSVLGGDAAEYQDRRSRAGENDDEEAGVFPWPAILLFLFLFLFIAATRGERVVFDSAPGSRLGRGGRYGAGPIIVPGGGWGGGSSGGFGGGGFGGFGGGGGMSGGGGASGSW